MIIETGPPLNIANDDNVRLLANLGGNPVKYRRNERPPG